MYSPPPKVRDTPQSDKLEQLRKELKQERTPAYGDALRLCRKLEYEAAYYKHMYEELADRT